MSAEPFQVVAICGSLSAVSSNKLLLETAIRLAPPGIRVTLFDGLATLPQFNPDLDRTLDDSALPPAVRAMRAEIAAANALVISSPEYAHGVPGSLKNALDWLVGGAEMVAMPVALWNTAPHATHAQASLAETLRTMSARLVSEAALSISLRGRPRDVDGLAADVAVSEPLVAALDALRREANDRTR